MSKEERHQRDLEQKPQRRNSSANEEPTPTRQKQDITKAITGEGA